jgi:hypothetical protein
VNPLPQDLTSLSSWKSTRMCCLFVFYNRSENLYERAILHCLNFTLPRIRRSEVLPEFQIWAGHTRASLYILDCDFFIRV